MIKKTLLPTDDLYIQFTDEEIKEFGWEAGQKLSIIPQDDGSFKIVPFVKMEIDIENWPRELLETLINESCEQDISVNDVICNCLKESLHRLEKHPTEEDLEQAKKDLLLEMDYLYNSKVDPTSINKDTSIFNNQ